MFCRLIRHAKRNMINFFIPNERKRKRERYVTTNYFENRRIKRESWIFDHDKNYTLFFFSFLFYLEKYEKALLCIFPLKELAFREHIVLDNDGVQRVTFCICSIRVPVQRCTETMPASLRVQLVVVLVIYTNIYIYIFFVHVPT